MLSFWIPGGEPDWLLLVFAGGFAVLAAGAYAAVMLRREEEQDAPLIATLYATGLGILAVSELVNYLAATKAWSAADTFGISGTSSIVIAGIVSAVALVSIASAVVLQVIDERATYRQTHSMAH